jgi:hypothetical protein
VLGETWIAHHGQHGKQSTRGVIAVEQKDHPIVRGLRGYLGPTECTPCGCHCPVTARHW